MLVLSRKKTESVLVEFDGREVWVHVISVQGNRVRLGFEAAPEINVVRGEVHCAPPNPAMTEIDVDLQESVA